MYLGDVIGRVVATAKNETLDGRKLLLVRRLADGRVVVAVDAVGAGAGERVYVCRGREASFAFRPESIPADATIVGIVDRIDRVGSPPDPPRPEAAPRGRRGSGR